MRKGQLQLLERVKKIELTKEQIKMLSREDLTLNMLNDIFRVFEAINDYPADKAYEYVKNGGNIYNLWSGDKSGFTYNEYISLPIKIRENPCVMYNIRVIRKHSEGLTETFCDTARWYQQAFNIEGELNLYYLGDIISDKRLRYKRNVYHDDWKLDRDTLVYYAIFYQELMKLFTKRYKADLSKRLLTKAQKHLEENFGTELEYTRRQDNYDRIKRQELTTSEYIEFLKEKLHGKIYVLDYADKDISPRDAANAVMGDILTAEKSLDPEKTKKFYNLFQGYEDFEHTEYRDDQERKDVEHMRDNTLLTGKLDISSTKIDVQVPKEMYEGKPIFIDFKDSKQLSVMADKDGNRIIFKKFSDTNRLIVYEDGAIYKKKYGKYQQATVRDVVLLFSSHHGMEILDKILEIPAIKGSYVLKDLVKDCRRAIISRRTFPSVLWNTCIGYKNRNQLFHTLYKNSNDINFNKMGTSNGYAYMKTRPYVNEQSQGILYNAFMQHTLTGYTCISARKQNAVAQAVVTDYLSQKLEKLYPDRLNDIQIEVKDYVVNTLNGKNKLNLKWRSITKITQQNVDTVLLHQNEKTEKIVIPKKSRFNALEENLPPEFERIRTRKRIILEGSTMRHCVASYAGEVNKDQCGIFHLTYADKGYTVEFRITRGKYNVFQIQSKANRGAPKEVWDYIKGLIKDIKVPQPIQTKKKRGKG